LLEVIKEANNFEGNLKGRIPGTQIMWNLKKYKIEKREIKSFLRRR